jgi:CRP-like cAMP-binding protein
MDQGTPPPTSNRILNALPKEEYERLSPHLEPVALPLGEVLYRPEDPITHVYFPDHGTVSVVCVLADGKMVEAGMVGNEGMFGVNVFLGSVTTPLEAIVQLPGDGLRMPAEVLRGKFRKGGLLQDMLLRYTQAFIVQLAQTTACNRAHPLDGRLARWLLTLADRLHGEELHVTHEHIADMLGVRRASITDTLAALRAEGLIETGRGTVTIVDRPRMEEKACECYGIIKDAIENFAP